MIGGKCDRIFEPKDQCFIIYDYESREIEDVIGKSVKSAGLEPVISKHIKMGESTGMYCTTICEPIRSSCITDISEENTNAGLGLAWRYGKPVILSRDKQKSQTYQRSHVSTTKMPMSWKENSQGKYKMLKAAWLDFNG
ncbi:MAG: hypothetical protein PHD13_01095 [Methanocellales archaeon]|nr:hypothetical protein [Methanocellales archaeon]MDD3291352.1 hypothetical protein [Methanocellales archaeon]MDD5234758.1 hypothetical protein [Methanocellales archaeon]MDD5484891.1 hypothetical protein [Methanocellales archaeon]